MLLYIVGVVVVVVGVALSIGLHELGHLIPAKLFGVRVSQYMIGFGPTVFSRTKGETEYGLKAIPLGGYVSMAGMYPPARPGSKAASGFISTMVQDARAASADAMPAGSEDRVFYRLPIWKRIIIMLGGPFMNLVIATVLFAVIISGIGSQVQTTTVGTVSQCVLPASSKATRCAAIDKPSPAADAGLKAGDTIVSINGVHLTSWEQESTVIRALAGTTVPIVVERRNTKLTLSATITKNLNYAVGSTGRAKLDAAGKLVTVEVGFLGIGPATAFRSQSPALILPTVVNTTGADFALIGALPQKLVGVAQAAFGTHPRDRNGPIGVLGVGRLAGEAATLDQPLLERLALLLSFIASLNVALFAFNMIPLLPLDGGHIIGAMWEGVRRAFAKIFKRTDPGPVDIARLVPLTYLVVIVLGAMSLLLLYADIVKPVTLQ